MFIIVSTALRSIQIALGHHLWGKWHWDFLKDEEIVVMKYECPPEVTQPGT